MTQSSKPYLHDKATVLIRERLSLLTQSKPERVIAAEAGFKSTNMLSMIKGGRAKVPLERVPGIAGALGCDPMLLLRLALEQHLEEGSEGLTYARTICVTANDQDIIGQVRSASNRSDPELTPDRAAFLRDAFAVRR